MKEIRAREIFPDNLCTNVASKISLLSVKSLLGAGQDKQAIGAENNYRSIMHLFETDYYCQWNKGESANERAVIHAGQKAGRRQCISSFFIESIIIHNKLRNVMLSRIFELYRSKIRKLLDSFLLIFKFLLKLKNSGV